MELIIFDLGKVLIDYDMSRISSKLYSHSKFPYLFTEDYIHETLFNYENGLTNIYDKGLLTDEEFFNKLKKEFHLILDFKDFVPIWNEIFFEIPQMKETVEQLKNRYSIYLLSNTNSLHFNYLKDKFDILNLIDEMILSYEVKSRKPETEIYKLAIEKSGFPPSTILFIDDREVNVSAARELGMKGLVFKIDSFKEDLNQIIKG